MALHEIIHEQGHWWVYTLEEHLARNCWCLVLSFRRPSTGTFVYDMVLYHGAQPDEATVTWDLRRMQGNILLRLAPAETSA